MDIKEVVSARKLAEAQIADILNKLQLDTKCNVVRITFAYESVNEKNGVRIILLLP